MSAVVLVKLIIFLHTFCYGSCNHCHFNLTKGKYFCRFSNGVTGTLVFCTSCSMKNICFRWLCTAYMKNFPSKGYNILPEKQPCSFLDPKVMDKFQHAHHYEAWSDRCSSCWLVVIGALLGWRICNFAVSQHVCAESVFPCRSVWAHSARIRLFPRMSAYVFLEAGLGGEGEGAHWAHIWFVSCVS